MHKPLIYSILGLARGIYNTQLELYLINQDHVKRLARILAALDAADSPEQLDAPGWGLHKLKGELKDFYAVKVSGNWRVIFRFEDGDVIDVDYLDYH